MDTSNFITGALFECVAIVQAALFVSRTNRQLKRQEAIVEALGLYTDSIVRLESILDTGVRNKLSDAQRARLIGFYESSLAFLTLVHVEYSDKSIAKRWRKSSETSLDLALSTAWAWNSWAEAECDALEQTLETRAFDEDLRASAAYARAENVAPTSAICQDELESLFESQGPRHGHGTACLPQSYDHLQPNDEPVDNEGLAGSDIRSMTSTFAADVESLSADPSANKAEKQVLVLNGRGGAIPLVALLDTGATVNCIAEALSNVMRSESNMRRLPHTKSIKQADSSYIDATHVMKCTWQFKGKQTCYTHIFYVVPELPRDLIICRQAIFKHEFLVDNIELCSLGLPKDFEVVPELYVLGLTPQTKGSLHNHFLSTIVANTLHAQREKQSLEAKQKQKANVDERRKQMDQMKQQISERRAAISRTTVSSSQASGSSSGMGASSNRS